MQFAARLDLHVASRRRREMHRRRTGKFRILRNAQPDARGSCRVVHRQASGLRRRDDDRSPGFHVEILQRHGRIEFRVRRRTEDRRVPLAVRVPRRDAPVRRRRPQASVISAARPIVGRGLQRGAEPQHSHQDLFLCHGLVPFFSVDVYRPTAFNASSANGTLSRGCTSCASPRPAASVSR